MFENIKSKVLTEKQLPDIRKKHNLEKIVFCTGCYDILQSGHAVFFNQCKEFGDILVVGVGSDYVISRLKGPSRPVNPQANRVYLVASMQDVDYAVINGNEIKQGKIDFENVVSKLRPDIFVLNDDDSALKEKEELCIKYGAELKLVSRVVPPELEPTSTTRIIDKINFAFRAPLRIDFSGGWTDIPHIMNNQTGYVCNAAIKPLIEYKEGQLNFSGYPRGSGLSTSTAVNLLSMISSKDYNVSSKTLPVIAEDLFNLENKELKWSIGRQDQYGLVYGGLHLFEFGNDYAKPVNEEVPREVLEKFKKNLLLLHTGASRNAQMVVEQVYRNYDSQDGKEALVKIGNCAKRFYDSITKEDFVGCAQVMEENFMAQKQLAPSTSNEYLDAIYNFAKEKGAYGGKICGAGGGGAFIFYCENPLIVKNELKKKFAECFEVDFEFEYSNIKELNKI